MSHIANYFTKTLLFVLFITVLINVRTSAQSETTEIIIIEEVCSFDELINRFKG